MIYERGKKNFEDKRYGMREKISWRRFILNDNPYRQNCEIVIVGTLYNIDTE